MAQTFNIVCHHCKTHLWVGQTMAGEPPERYIRIYSLPNYVDRFKAFLDAHREHLLGWLESQQIPDDYEDAEPEEAEPPTAA